jgi:hypothetical protein
MFVCRIKNLRHPESLNRNEMSHFSSLQMAVIPAEAGIQGKRFVGGPWTPAFAGGDERGNQLFCHSNRLGCFGKQGVSF